MAPGAWGAPLAPLYGFGVALRHWAFDLGLLRSVHAGVPTVSVGGLEAGGSGKTPVTGFVLRALRSAGRAPGLLTRGYGRGHAELRLRRAGEAPRVVDLGDEATMLVSQGIDVPVAAVPRRRLGAQTLVELGCDCLVLDDGFSHRALARDVDIVVVRAEAPHGKARMLPWGTLREPLASLSRAHLVWWQTKTLQAPQSVPERLRELAPKAQWVHGRLRPAGVWGRAGEPLDVRVGRWLAATGIAWPEDFFARLQADGVTLLETWRYADHHAFSAADAAHLCERCQALGADGVVVTDKDAVKLLPLWPQDAPELARQSVRVEVVSGAPALALALGIPVSALVDPSG